MQENPINYSSLPDSQPNFKPTQRVYLLLAVAAVLMLCLIVMSVFIPNENGENSFVLTIFSYMIAAVILALTTIIVLRTTKPSVSINNRLSYISSFCQTNGFIFHNLDIQEETRGRHTVFDFIPDAFRETSFRPHRIAQGGFYLHLVVEGVFKNIPYELAYLEYKNYYYDNSPLTYGFLSILKVKKDPNIFLHTLKDAVYFNDKDYLYAIVPYAAFRKTEVKSLIESIKLRH
jgi:hypothetical protein